MAIKNSFHTVSTTEHPTVRRHKNEITVNVCVAYSLLIQSSLSARLIWKSCLPYTSLWRLMLFTLLTAPQFHCVVSLLTGQPGAWPALTPSLKQQTQSGDCGCWQRCHPWAMLKPGLTLKSSADTLPPHYDPLAGNDTALYRGNVTTLGSAMTWYKVI